jgi:hypothetical protein
MERIKYNIWVSIEKVTTTDDDEIYEDDWDRLPVKYACTDDFEQACDILDSLDSTRIGNLCD